MYNNMGHVRNYVEMKLCCNADSLYFSKMRYLEFNMFSQIYKCIFSSFPLVNYSDLTECYL